MIRKNGEEFPQNKESGIESVRGFVVQNNLGPLCYTLGQVVTNGIRADLIPC